MNEPDVDEIIQLRRELADALDRAWKAEDENKSKGTLLGKFSEALIEVTERAVTAEAERDELRAAWSAVPYDLVPTEGMGEAWRQAYIERMREGVEANKRAATAEAALAAVREAWPRVRPNLTEYPIPGLTDEEEAAFRAACNALDAALAGSSPTAEAETFPDAEWQTYARAKGWLPPRAASGVSDTREGDCDCRGPFAEYGGLHHDVECAIYAASPVPAVADDPACDVHPFSSRVCEMGTKGCTVIHAGPGSRGTKETGT